jgi:hypothetical protein
MTSKTLFIKGELNDVKQLKHLISFSLDIDISAPMDWCLFISCIYPITPKMNMWKIDEQIITSFARSKPDYLTMCHRHFFFAILALALG